MRCRRRKRAGSSAAVRPSSWMIGSVVSLGSGHAGCSFAVGGGFEDR